ncbi:MAG: hypothetical protein CRN43_05185 [Candidatus Nephrothrix sp. EaCA]|nr:MAG: hypothetical protein CRN43_05185 [Candidatus Nephrothrix sp. EaCA]
MADTRLAIIPNQCRKWFADFEYAKFNRLKRGQTQRNIQMLAIRRVLDSSTSLARFYFPLRLLGFNVMLL